MSLITLPNLYQPKGQIAERVAAAEAAGVLVPTRFKSFEEALASGTDFIARSEHPREFAGESGILESFAVTQQELELARQWSDDKVPTRDHPRGRADWQRRALNRILRGGSQRDFEIELATTDPRTLATYCKLYEMPEAEFLRDVSYSYWQLLGGWNRTVVADDTIAGRYHLFTVGTANPTENHNYTIIENERIVASGGAGFAPKLILGGAADLIGFYESVRRLPFFDPNHCPIIECQFINGVHYFLQYHVGRDYKPAGFELTREAQDGEVEVSFVRGATPPEGITVQTAFYYPHGNETLMPSEDASFELSQMQNAFTEIMSRRRKVTFLREINFVSVAHHSWNAHLPKTQIFKAMVSLTGGDILHKFFPRDLLKSLFERTEDEQIPARIPLHVTSDGRRALVKRLN